MRNLTDRQTIYQACYVTQLFVIKIIKKFQLNLIYTYHTSLRLIKCCGHLNTIKNLIFICEHHPHKIVYLINLTKKEEKNNNNKNNSEKRTK